MEPALNPGPLARAPLLILAFVALLSGALAGLYPSQTSMRWPYLIMGVLFLFCIEAAFVAVWKLFSLSGSGANSSR